MATVISQDLESIVRNNLKILGISESQQQPVVDCHCSISTQRVPVVSGTAVSGLATDVPAVAPQQATPTSATPVNGKMPFVDQSVPIMTSEEAATAKQVLASQFVQGLTTIPTDLKVYPELPGNEAFVLPAGITPDAIVQAQQIAAEEAYQAELTKEERIAQEAKVKAEQEAAALAAKAAAAIRTTTVAKTTPVAVAVAVTPTSTTAAASPAVTTTPAVTTSLASTPSSTSTGTTVTVKETFASFPRQIGNLHARGAGPQLFGFDTETILLFLVVGLVVYRMSVM